MITNLATTLRSLTASPLTGLLHETRRMARRYLNAGGAVGSKLPAVGDFVVPDDIDPTLFAAALGNSGSTIGSSAKPARAGVSLLKVFADGRIVVPRDHVERIGDGDGDGERGRHRLERIVVELRHRRVLSRIRQPVLVPAPPPAQQDDGTLASAWPVGRG